MTYAIAAIIGTLLGFVSAKTFFAHSWTALFPWALLGLVIGYCTKNKKTSLWSGAVYGFTLPVSFLYFGFQGTGGMHAGFVLLMLVLGVIGAWCGVVLALIGKKLHRRP